jgi:hypothetical protein
VKTENNQNPGLRDSAKSKASRYYYPYGLIGGEPSDEDRHRLMAGRLAAVAAVLAFISCYVYGIAKFGVVLGIAIGWLPSGIIAWLAALVVAPLTTALLRDLALARKNLSSRAQDSKLHL